MSFFKAFSLFLAGLAPFWASPAPLRAALTFTNVTAATGTGGPSTAGGHGVQFVDADGDGLTDIYVTMIVSGNSDLPNLFYRNLGGGLFAEEAALRGIDDEGPGTHGGTWADLDNDGDFDRWHGSWVANQVFQNNGMGQFQNMTPGSGIPPERAWRTRGVAAFDMDGDGDLDLFAVNGSSGTGAPADERNEVYRNEGGFTFTPVNQGDLYTAPAAQGATDSDFDGDGDVDILTADPGGVMTIVANDGAGNFTLIEPATLGLTASVANAVTLADVDNDGHLDMLLDRVLYVNDGDNTYTSRGTVGGGGYMGGFEDLDNDGDWDIVIAGEGVAYLNDGTGHFPTTVSFEGCGGEAWLCDPRSVAFGDIDGDGDSDLFFANKRVLNSLIRNDLDSTNRWLNVRLVRASGQAAAFGAKVQVFSAGLLGSPAGRISWREARSQEGYLGQNDPLLHFGLGSADTVDLLVVFPGGLGVEVPGVEAGRTRRVLEGVEVSVAAGALSWTGLLGAGGYDVVRGDVGELLAAGGDYSATAVSCLTDGQPGTGLAEGAVPAAPGQAFWYLVRAEGAGNGFDLAPTQAASRNPGLAVAAGACP